MSQEEELIELINSTFKQAHALYYEGKFAETLAVLNGIINKPNLGVIVYHLYAAALSDLKDYAATINLVEQLMDYPYDNMINLKLLLASAYGNSENYPKAIQTYREAIALDPNNLDIYHSLALCHLYDDRPDTALEIYQSCFTRFPDVDHHATALKIGEILVQQGKLVEAAATYVKVGTYQGITADWLYNAGYALQSLNQFDEARNLFQKAVAQDPLHAKSHLGLAEIDLIHGDYEQGLERFEWRWGSPPHTNLSPKKPLWQGEALAGQVLLLYTNHGIGDTLQFLRYLPFVKQRDAKVIVEMHVELMSLLDSYPNIDYLHKKGDKRPDYDFHQSLGNLPRIFKTRIDTIPNHCPYVSATVTKKEYWRQRLAPYQTLKVGLIWATAQAVPDIKEKKWNNEGEKNHKAKNNIAFSYFEVLKELTGITFFLCQKGLPAEHDYVSGDWGNNFVSLSPEIHDFSDTAGIFANLDLVISADSSPAHLAGAMGIPTWVLLKIDPCWRWLLERRDSPWYPSIKLYRQTVPNDWTAVIEEVKQDLLQMTLRPLHN